MSLFLFLIVAERLARLVRQITKKQLYQGVKIGTREVAINLLQFVDDILLLCETKTDNIKVIKQTI